MAIILPRISLTSPHPPGPQFGFNTSYLRHICCYSFYKHLAQHLTRSYQRVFFCSCSGLMESQSTKGSGFNVMEGKERKGTREDDVVKFSLEGTLNLVLRLIALVLTLVATIVIIADKQTTVVPIKFLDSLPPIDVPVTAKWHYMSANVYFVVANVTACAYATLSLIIALANGHKSKVLGTLATLLDALMVALLFSANGAAFAVGVLGKQGNSHVRWNKVCNVFGKFCDQSAASFLISLLGSLAFLSLVVLPVLRLQRKTF